MKNIYTKTEKSLKQTFRSLKYRNFRLFFFGQGISLIGTWIQRIATPWLVYSITDSAFMLGFIGFLGQSPTLILSTYAGVVADKFDKQKLLIITQVGLMIQALILAILYLTGNIEVWHIIVLNIIHGILNSFDVPVRQSMVAELVDDKDDLSNAIALNSTIFNGARLVGPSVAGILIALTGEGICFLINALSFIFVIISIMMMKFPPHIPIKSDKSTSQHLKEGWKYTFGFRPIRNIILLLVVVNLFGMIYQVLMPVMAKKELGGGPNTFGILMAATGVGALIAAIYLASRKNALGLAKLIYTTVTIFGIGLILFALSHNFIISIALMVLTGMSLMLTTASGNTVIQTLVDDDKRGRVMSYYSLAFLGTAPIGSLLSGWLADMFGVTPTIIFSGIICIIAGIVYFKDYPNIKDIIKPIYIKMGILK